jgi:hypothetical protein
MSWSSIFENAYTEMVDMHSDSFGWMSPPTPRVGDIQVRPEELTRTAEICYQVGTNLNKTLEEVHSIMNEFFNSDVFEGQQAETVRNNYTNATENLDRFPQMVVWFGGKLEQASIAFTEADKDNITLAVETMFATTFLPMLPAEFQSDFFVRFATDMLFQQQVLAYLEKAGAFLEDNSSELFKAGRALKGLKSLYDVSKGTNVTFATFGTASRFGQGMAVAGAALSLGMGFYEAFTGTGTPEMIAAELTSGLIQAAMGFTGVGTVVLAVDALVQFVGPYVADVMRDNADWLAGGGIEAEDIVAAANKFDQAIKDIDLDERLDGTFNALYSGDILGALGQGVTFMNGVVNFMDSGIDLAGYAVGGLINQLIPGAGGPIAGIISTTLQITTMPFTLPARALSFAIDLFTGDAQLGDMFSGVGNFIGNALDSIGLSGAGDWVRDISGSIASGVNTAVDAVVDFATDAWNETVNWVSDAAGEVGGFFEDAGNAVADFFTSGC